MDKGGIYKLTSPSGKCYIGQTNNFRVRINKYKNLHCKDQPLIYNAIKKYGWDNFKVEFLYETLYCFKYIREYINYLEEKLIMEYKTTDRNFGYNLQYGGGTNYHSDETKQKMSIIMKGKVKTKEHCKNISLSKKGIPNDKRGVPVLMFDLNNNFIKEYQSVIMASKENKINIDSCLSGRCKRAGKYIFKYKNKL